MFVKSAKNRNFASCYTKEKKNSILRILSIEYHGKNKKKGDR